LIQQFFRELNTQYSNNLKKISSTSGQCPLAISRVKVTFRDEPGEGSGVARSFYSAIAEVRTMMTRLSTSLKLPPSNDVFFFFRERDRFAISLKLLVLDDVVVVERDHAILSSVRSGAVVERAPS
jgi:hypothetical protein